MDCPTLPNLCGLSSDQWSHYVSKELSSLDDEIELTERLLYMCMKLGAPLTVQTASNVKQVAFARCG